MAGASENIPTEPTSEETSADKASSSEGQEPSYMVKTMRFFYGHIFGGGSDDAPKVLKEEEIVQQEEEISSEEEEEEEQIFEQDNRSQLVTMSSYEEDQAQKDVATAAAASTSAEALKDVCKFWAKGQCKFGDKCYFSHPPELAPAESKLSPKSRKKLAKKRAKQKREEEDDERSRKGGKKPAMKTAMDVIKRIQWDEALPAERFTIGYIDRFTGVQEEPFNKFSNWGDLANAELDALAVPQHRIQYFKYRGVKVWDKAERLDEVFGSAGKKAASIEAFMDAVDDRLRRDALPARVNEADTPNGSFDGSAEDSDSDSDDSDDDEIGVNIGAEASSDAAPASFPCTLAEEERSTHFVAIQVTNNAIIERAVSVQDHLVAQEPALAECCMKPGLFHVTLGMMRLRGQAGVDEAKELLRRLQPALEEARGARLRVAGLETFGQRVLYAKVEPEPSDAFWALVAEFKNLLAETSDNVSVTDKFDLTPHMTLVKVNRPISRLRRSKYLPSALYERHTGAEFGVQSLDNLQLCVIEASTRFDGFYLTAEEIRL